MKKRFLIFLTLLFNLTVIAQTKSSKTENPIKTVERIFNQYVKYSESVDSDDNKLSMQRSFEALKDKAKPEDLPLLINVWMYYDPTDFGTRKLIEPIFFKNKQVALDAVNKRLKNKRKTENIQNAPYADLVDLQTRLQ